MKISVIIPVYNQSDKLLKNLSETILPFFDNLGLTYDVLIEADHSSLDEVKKIEDALPGLPANVKLVPYEDTKGKGFAVKKAILYSQCDYDLFMDADLATDLSIMNLIKPLLGQYDCFIGSRNCKGAKYVQKQPLVRQFTHWGARTLIKMKFGIEGVHDTQCGFKLFRDSVAKEMVKKQITNGNAFDVEYLYFLHLNGFSIKEMPAAWRDDPDSTAGSVWQTTKRFYNDLGIIKKNKKNYLLTEEERKALHADR